MLIPAPPAASTDHPGSVIPEDLAAPDTTSPDRPPGRPDLLLTLRGMAGRLAVPLLPAASMEVARARVEESALDLGARLGVGGISAAKGIVPTVEVAFAFATAELGAFFEFAGANLSHESWHFGLPHNHCHPPAFPGPLPSSGPVFIGGVQSVRIHGFAAARAGDLGLAPCCGSFIPPFQIATGSSKVFYGQHRAARTLDFTRFCKPASSNLPLIDALPKIDSYLSIVNAAGKSYLNLRGSQTAAAKAECEADAAVAESLSAESEGLALGAKLQAAQAIASANAQALQATIGLDPGAAPAPAMHGALMMFVPNVMIGGFPMPPTLKYLVGLRKELKKVPRPLKQFGASFTALARRRHDLPRELRFLTGHPVDVATGCLVIDTCDLELPGALPLRFTRSYSSGWSDRTSPLGRGWSHSLDEAVWLEPRHLVYRDEHGRELELLLKSGADEVYVSTHRLTLRRRPDNCWQIEDHDGIRRDFAPIPGDARPGRARPIQRSDRRGHTIHYRYDERARLVTVHAADGREILLKYDESDRLTGIDVPDPDGGRLVPHVRFVHDGEDLTEIHDALGKVTRYRHDHHRIVEETLPGDLRFHFTYDGETSDAACVRTWGDGGIVDHRLIYDRDRRTTVVTNACQETTIYHTDERGLVTEICDPRGATTRFEHDAELRRTAVIDPLGHTTRRQYDERGNLTREVFPDDTFTETTYHPTLDLPLVTTDRTGGASRWSYDAAGRITRHTVPLGRTTIYHHDPGNDHIETTVHADGRSEQRIHDAAGRQLEHRLSDGISRKKYTYDLRGRLRRCVDDRGRVEAFEYDLLGRLTRHALPDGDVRLYTHDARGRVVRACDAHSDLRCSYTGLGWLASCGTASTAPYTLERDLEGRITRVAGPTGTLLRIERDPAGRVRATVDALGVERRFTRDLRGDIVEVRRSRGKRTRYIRDASRRICAIDHGDGLRDEYAYDPYGAILTANRTQPDGTITTVRRQLDRAGRTIHEAQDDHAISLEYDPRDRLVRLRSSLGADLRFVHDDRGLARIEVPHDDWALSFERDRDGREQARHLPGEVLSWWQRDRHGRPLEHGLVASRPPQIFRQRRYTWSHRLDRIDEATRRRPTITPPTRKIHDSWSFQWNGAGELHSVQRADHLISYRHDALGRRICRTRDGLATRWLWHGDVPLHAWTHARDAITWVFEPNTFTPLARLAATGRHAIVGDHLGTPLAMFDERGQLDWSAEFDIHGHPHPNRGEPSLCPFRLPGQIEDPDTGLAHNRFRDLDPVTRRYLAPDPLGLIGGLDPHATVADPRTQTDVFGLSVDQGTDVHSRLAAELVHDFPATDLPPAIAAAVRSSAGVSDRQMQLAAIYKNPPRPPCG